MSKFFNMHSHTMHSHQDAIIRVDELFQKAKDQNLPAVAITDHGVMGGMWEAYNEYKKTGVKLIPGNEIYFVEDIEDKKSKRGHLILIAQNETGWKNLLRITAFGFEHAVKIMGKLTPRVNAEILEQNSEGIVCSTACMSSLISNKIFNNDTEGAKSLAKTLKGIFKENFYLELQPHDLSFTRANKKERTVTKFSQAKLNETLINFAKELDIEMIATCDSHYLEPEDEPYHDMIQAIASKEPLSSLNRKRYATREPCQACGGLGRIFESEESKGSICPSCAGTGVGKIIPSVDYYLKSEDEVREYFASNYSEELADKLIDNTYKIAESCDNPDYMEPTGVRLPVFNMHFISQNDDSDEFVEWKQSRDSVREMADDKAYLRFKCQKAFKEYTKSFDKAKKKVYWDRMLVEIDVFEARDFSSYMLIVADYINWAVDNDVYVGAGRGSGAGSLVGFFLGIHEVDPLRYNLLFDRFLNKYKKAFPDIDTDFAPSGRPKVYDYIVEKYGHDHFAMISNLNRMTPKVAIKDIARSLQVGGDKSTAFRLANDVTADIPDTYIREDGKKVKVKTIDDALKTSQKLRGFAEDYPDVIKYARKLVGLPRAFSVHAGGVIISDVPLTEYTPLRALDDGRFVTQYDKEVCEETGLIKMDMLGIETLDIMKEAVDLAASIDINLPTPRNVPEGDENAFKMIQSGNVVGLFQLEGKTLAELCRPMVPTNIMDIAFINALGRPSCSREERKSFIDRRFGKEEVSYKHPLLKDITKNTMGISMFEEDLMILAQTIAGWDLSKADNLRKLTKMKEKGAEKAKEFEVEFVTDSIAHSNLSEEEAQMIWDDVIVPWSGYGFNLAHAVSYSILGYRSAYYKAYATAPFLCAVLNAKTKSNARDRDEKITSVKDEINKFKIKITPVDINKSKEYYIVSDRKTIVTGLGAVKGVGEAALNDIVSKQPFNSFPDFIHRTRSAVVKKDVIIALAKSGAFDNLGVSRKYVIDTFSDKKNKFRVKITNEFKKKAKENIKKEFPEAKTKEVNAKLKEYDLSTIELDLSKFEMDGDIETEFSLKEIMEYEKEVLNEYLSGTFDVLYPGFFKGPPFDKKLHEINASPDGSSIQFEGLIVETRELTIKNGKNAGSNFAIITLENSVGEKIESAVWPEDWEKIKPYLYKNDGLERDSTPFSGVFKVSTRNEKKQLALSRPKNIWRDK